MLWLNLFIIDLATITMFTEKWKDVPGYEGLYQVSNLGRVKSFHRGVRILKPVMNSYGYYMVFLYKDGKRKEVLVSRLVAEAFIPNPDNLPLVNHKSEVKTDNSVENLEWCDACYNMNYGTRNERMSQSLSREVQCFSSDGALISSYQSTREAERKTGICSTSISKCCLGERKTAGGYKWVYVI